MPLVQQLLALSEPDRRLVIAAVEWERELPAMPWETLDRARGIVSLGGNADDDCKALYDGDDVK